MENSMKKSQILTLTILLSMPILLLSSHGKDDRTKAITEKMNAIKDKQSAADFNNDELEKKKIELQKIFQDHIQLISSKLPTGTSDEQKSEKANLIDERSYGKIKLEARKQELQAKIIYKQSRLKSKQNELQALKNRSTELKTKLSTNKENGIITTAARKANIQDQQTMITNDIAEKTAELQKTQEELKQTHATLAELQKTLNNPLYK